MQIHRWIRFVALGFLLAILMAISIESSASALQCIDPVTKKDIPCPPADGGGGGRKKPTPSPYPSFTPTPTNTPTATVTPTATTTPDGLAVGQADPGQPAPQASFDKKNLFGAIVIGSLLVILIGLLLPGLRRGFGGSTKSSPTPPPPGMSSNMDTRPGDGKENGAYHELRKHQSRRRVVLQRFVNTLGGDRASDLVKSDEIRKFLHDAKRGSFGDKVPDGDTPGSEIPGVGTEDPLDVLDGLFGGIGSGLGEVDHPGQADPASGQPGDADFDDNEVAGYKVKEKRTANGDSENSTTITVTLRDGTVHTFYESYDEHGNSTKFEHDITRNNITAFFIYTPAADGGQDLHVGTIDASGPHGGAVLHLDRHGAIIHPLDSPGEGGGEANTDRNPLNNLNVIGPQSLRQMTNALRHPGSDTEQHDPNTGEGGRPLTDVERERLGRIVPAAELLDPNSGLDPLTGLHLDPNQMHHTHTEDDELDPNTGEQPMPGGG